MQVRLDNSLELILERAPSAQDSRVLATVVATAGSTYRKPGARMLLMADGTYIGLLSGGCLESDLQIHAREVLESGVARAVEYDTRGPDDVLFGVGAGCEGHMRVLLEPAERGSAAARALELAGAASQSSQATALIMVHDSARMSLGTHHAGDALMQEIIAGQARALAEQSSQDLDWGNGAERSRAFVQYLAPSPHLLICGAAPDAQPVSGIARRLGWRVSVVDHRPGYAVAAHFPGAQVRLANPRSLRAEVELSRCHAAIVMSHHLPSDALYLRELAQAGYPGFVGLLGPTARRKRLEAELAPLTAMLGTRLRGPVGLDIGAQTPDSIALAIVGQIHAWLAGRP